MRVNLLALLLILFSCGVLLADTGVGQSITQTRVTLELKHESLKSAILKIQKQTRFLFAYQPQQVREFSDLNLPAATRSVGATLDLLLQGTGLTYKIVGKNIIIYRNAEPEQVADHHDSVATTTPVPPSQGFPVRGRVVDSLNTPLYGVTVIIKGTRRGTSTDNDGWFDFKNVPPGSVLVISFTGYFPREIPVEKNRIEGVILRLNPSKIPSVEVVSTGYQTLPRERSTGSFDVIDNKLFNRSVSPNLLDHLNGIASGVLFDNRRLGSIPSDITQGRTETFSIRGLSTINSSSSPLIIVDGFPYNSSTPYIQDINNLNPNDIESVTILKDAAAASIWGARAGNGVVVITTKSGKYNQKPVVSFTAGMTITAKPDLFSQHLISTSDYITVEDSLYSQGYYSAYYTNPLNSLGRPVSQVVNLLFQVQAGTLTQAQANAQISALSKIDDRHDILKYFYRTGVNQQYSASVHGGSPTHKYFISAGFDDNNSVDFSYEKRVTLNVGNTFKPLKDLEIALPMTYTNMQIGTNVSTNTQLGAASTLGGGYGSFSPYTKFTDADGNPQNVTFSGGYNPVFIQDALTAGLYDMSMNPINQFHASQYNHNNNYMLVLNPEIRYVLPLGFTADVKYQYSRTSANNTQYQSDSVWGIKNLINNYTQIGTTGSLSYPINRGGELLYNNSAQVNNNIRASVSYNHNISADHRLDAIAGYERNETHFDGNQYGWYGYNPQTGVFQTTVDYVTYYPLTNYKLVNYPFPITSTIAPLAASVTQQFLAYISWFGNAAYTYKNRYTLSGSGRIDQANLFGVNTNDKKKILWSAGGGWKIDQEEFYHVKWLPLLKVRTTFGYQGNTPSITVRSVPTITYYSPTTNSSLLPYAALNNIPNPDLRWEKVGQLNLGLDFGMKNERVTGTVEYFYKKGSDLIAPYSLDPTVGATTRTGNVADMTGRGVDVTINTRNVTTKDFEWDTKVLFSQFRDRLTKYLVTTTANAVISAQATSPYPNSGSPTPIVGNSVYGVYSLKWAGLDGNGNPQGYDTLGKVSTNYSQLVNSSRLKDMVYSGPANPTIFGSFMNSFTYKRLSVSANITYKAGYYFHAQSVNYSTLFGSNMLNVTMGSSDFSKRWQKPGDEKTTFVPSMPTIANSNYLRDYFYQYSSVLVQKGDNIRLRDISLSYDLGSTPAIRRSPFSSFVIYGYFNGDILLWKANKMGIDPDYPTMNPPKSYSFGIRTTFK